MRARSLPGVLLVVALAGGCSIESTLAEREDGVITKAGKISVFDLRAGDCLLPDDDRGDVEETRAVPCSSPHTHEVIGVPVLAGAPDEYPGRTALERIADSECGTAARSYLGARRLDASLSLDYLVPSEKSWNDDDRQLTCVVVSAQKMTGSVRPSAP